jgi:hypothetical protein
MAAVLGPVKLPALGTVAVSAADLGMSMSTASTAGLGMVSSGWRIGSFGGHHQNPTFSELPGRSGPQITGAAGLCENCAGEVSFPSDHWVFSGPEREPV